MSRALKRVLMLLVVAVYISLGYLRDFLFVNINFALKKLNSGESYEGHSFMEFLQGYDWWTLYISKYPLTGLFTVLNFLPGLFLLYLLFGERRYLRWFAWLYACVIGFSLLLFAGGYLFGDPDQGYILARYFMGFLQSPLPVMMFIPLVWLYQRERVSREQ